MGLERGESSRKKIPGKEKPQEIRKVAQIVP